MTRNKLVLLVLVIVTVFAVWRPTGAQQRERFEYRVLKSFNQDMLNSAGNDGWEAVSVFTDPSTEQAAVVLKRHRVQ